MQPTACDIFDGARAGDRPSPNDICSLCDQPRHLHVKVTFPPNTQHNRFPCCSTFQPIKGSTQCCARCGRSEKSHLRKRLLCRVVPKEAVAAAKANCFFAEGHGLEKDIQLFELAGQLFFTLPIATLKKNTLRVPFPPAPRGFVSEAPTVSDSNYWFTGRGDDVPAGAEDEMLWKPVTLQPPTAEKQRAFATFKRATTAEFFRYGVYDLYIKFDPKLMALYDQGWAIQDLSGISLLEKEIKTLFVAITGRFNAGKTTLLQWLSGVPLPCGLTVHTEGVSIITTKTNNEDEQIAWFDQIGQDSRVAAVGDSDAPPASDHVQGQLQAVRDRFAEAKAVEDFLRNVAIKVADVFIHVIDKVRSLDHLELMRIAARTHRLNTKKEIFIVHNLRGWTVDKLKASVNGTAYYEKIAEIFSAEVFKFNVDVTCKVEQPDGTFMEETKTVELIRLDGSIEGNSGSPVSVQHFFLLEQPSSLPHPTHDGNVAPSLEKLEKCWSWNRAVVALLRERIHNVLTGPSTLKGVLQNTFTTCQSTFAHVQDSSQVKLVKDSDANEWKFRAEVTSKPICNFSTGPGRISVADPDFQYNVSSFNDNATNSKKQPGYVLLQITVPGLAPSAIEAITARNPSPKAIRVKVVKTGGSQISLQLELDNATQYIAKDQPLSDDELSTFFGEGTKVELGELQSLPGGTRPKFDPSSRHRPVKFCSTFNFVSNPGALINPSVVRPLSVQYTSGILTIAWKRYRPQHHDPTAAAAA